MPWDIFYSIYKCLRIVEKWTTFFFFYVETIWSALSRCFSDSLLLIMNSFIYAVGHYVAVKVKPERFFWFTIIIRLFCLVGKFVEHGTLMNQLRYIRVSDSWRIWNTVRIKLFHHDEKGMEDLIYSSNFSVRCYLSLIQKNSRTFLACFIISFYTELIPKKTCLSRTCMFMGGPPVILIVAWIFCHHS